MKRFGAITMSLMWGITIILLIGSLVGLSMNLTWGVDGIDLKVPAPNETGWQVMAHSGVGPILRGYVTDVENGTIMTWWYGAEGLKDPYVLVGALATVLIIVTPFMIVFSAFVTYRMVRAILYPRSIEFVDTINDMAKAKKNLHKTAKLVRAQVKKGTLDQAAADDMVKKAKVDLETKSLAYQEERKQWLAARHRKQAFRNLNQSVQ